MAKGINKLSAKQVQSLKDVGRYSDGGGLYIQIARSRTKSWLFRFMLNGIAREMGLGPVKDLSLAEARLKAQECRILVKQKIDPIEKRKKEQAALLKAAQTKQSFQECKEGFLKAHSSSWKNKKHIQQWENTLESYALPIIGKMDIKDVDTAAIMRILDPIWKTKTETAKRLRGRIERILDWATVQGFRQGDNPARWKGHLSELLAAPTTLMKVKHMPSMPYAEIPSFIEKLEEIGSIGSKALRYLILTATRSSEVRLAQWDEIDMSKGVWTIPDERMKANKEHTIPLCNEALSILNSLPRMVDNPYIFTGIKSGRPISDMTLTKILRDQGIKKITVHGFRSSFRDWAGEQTNYPRNVIEFCLAHKLKDKVEAAYHRSNLLEKRRPLMEQWAKHCFSPAIKEGAKVIKLNQSK